MRIDDGGGNRNVARDTNDEAMTPYVHGAKGTLPQAQKMPY